MDNDGFDDMFKPDENKTDTTKADDDDNDTEAPMDDNTIADDNTSAADSADWDRAYDPTSTKHIATACHICV